jgi:hypothetical protein
MDNVVDNGRIKHCMWVDQFSSDGFTWSILGLPALHLFSGFGCFCFELFTRELDSGLNTDNYIAYPCVPSVARIVLSDPFIPPTIILQTWLDVDIHVKLYIQINTCNIYSRKFVNMKTTNEEKTWWSQQGSGMLSSYVYVYVYVYVSFHALCLFLSCTWCWFQMMKHLNDSWL